jgi:uncharacterized protein GlcG (DUF336 family)
MTWPPLGRELRTGRKIEYDVAATRGEISRRLRAWTAPGWAASIFRLRKARTARFFDMNTGDLGAASQPGGSLYNIEVSNGGLITFPGGIPLRLNGEVVGGIGVSGSSVENDHTVAEAGANALT